MPSAVFPGAGGSGTHRERGAGEPVEPSHVAFKDMSRWLGDGGMPIIEAVGAAFEDYGVDGEDLGWAEGSFVPRELACNPHGIVQAGVHSLLLDACMNFAINAALTGRDRTRGTLELKTETMRPARRGTSYWMRGDVVRLARQVAYGEAAVRDEEGELISRSTGTFLLHREDAGRHAEGTERPATGDQPDGDLEEPDLEEPDLEEPDLEEPDHQAGKEPGDPAGIP